MKLVNISSCDKFASRDYEFFAVYVRPFKWSSCVKEYLGFFAVNRHLLTQSFF